MWQRAFLWAVGTDRTLPFTKRKTSRVDDLKRYARSINDRIGAYMATVGGRPARRVDRDPVVSKIAADRSTVEQALTAVRPAQPLSSRPERDAAA